MKAIFDQLKGMWTGGTAQQRGLAILSTLVLALGISAAVWFATRPDPALLFGGLEPADASAVVDELRAAGVEPEVRDGGRSVWVPKDKVAELRMRVSSAGLPRGSGTGWELFDKSNFGVSDFVQNVNYRRALEGELARDVASFDAVESASVRISTPRRSPFVGDRQQPKASVVLKLRAGGVLPANNVQAIQHFVAGAVEGLDAGDVRVMDTEMRLLSRNGGDAVAAETDNQLEFRAREEESRRKSAEEMLARVGVQADVRVAMEFDFQRLRETSEKYAPTGTVASETVESHSTKGGQSSSGGPVGTEQTIKEPTPPGDGVTSDERQETATTTYNVSRTVAERQLTTPVLKRISVSLVVDKSHEADLTRIEEVVKTAVGFDKNRGDTISTLSYAFATPETNTEPEPGGSALMPILIERGVEVLGIIGAIVILMQVLRVASKREAPRPRAVVGAGNAGADGARGAPRNRAGAGGAAGGGGSTAAEELLPLDDDSVPVRDLVKIAVERNKERATRVLRDWMQEGGSN